MPEPLSESKIDQLLEDLPNWSYQDDKIKASYEFDDFREAIAFIVRISFEAEERNHHPELENVYNTVDIALTTHDADGKVTSKDFDLAEAIEKVASSS